MEKLVNDLDILDKQLKELDLDLEKNVQNEELSRVKQKRSDIDSQKKESEKLIQESELVKLKGELQATNLLLEEFKLSLFEYFENFILFYIFDMYG